MAVQRLTHEGHLHSDDAQTKRACRETRHRADGVSGAFGLGYQAALAELDRLVAAQHGHAGNTAWAVNGWLDENLQDY
jgi:hypothetical protein